jgi:hypothetical protein
LAFEEIYLKKSPYKPLARLFPIAERDRYRACSTSAKSDLLLSWRGCRFCPFGICSGYRRGVAGWHSLTLTRIAALLVSEVFAQLPHMKNDISAQYADQNYGHITKKPKKLFHQND